MKGTRQMRTQHKFETTHNAISWQFMYLRTALRTCISCSCQQFRVASGMYLKNKLKQSETNTIIEFNGQFFYHPPDYYVLITMLLHTKVGISDLVLRKIETS